MRVLLIDDDTLVREMLAETLAAEDIEVDGLANAEDALVLLGANQVPDVLVTDVDLGGGLTGPPRKQRRAASATWPDARR